MIMGLETPVAMPVMDVYNTDLMRAYIAGVKEQYDQGQQEMKDFMKLYNDFYSPIAGETEKYHDLTTGGAMNMINNMLANGIDPYKSPEARAAISRYINNVPTGTLNAMKQNADNYRTYQAAVAKARANGRFNPEMENMELEAAGLNDFQTVDPITGELRTWDRLAPIDPKSLYELSLPQFQKYGKTEYLGPGSRKFWDLWGVSDPNKRSATEATVRAIDATPYARFYRQQAQNEVDAQLAAQGINASPERLQQLYETAYRQNILDEMNDYLQPQEKLNEVALKQWEVENNNRQKALDRQNARTIAEMKAKGDKKEESLRIPLSKQYIAKTSFAINDYKNKTSADKIKQFVDKAIEWRLNNPQKENNKTQQELIKIWSKILADPVKKGFMDKNGNWTNTAKTWFKRTGIDLRADDSEDLGVMFKGRSVGTNELNNAANKMYEQYVNRTGNPIEQNLVNDVLTGTSLTEDQYGTGLKARTFTTGKQYTFTPYRKASIFNGKNLISPIVKKFNQFLQDYTISMELRSYNTYVGAVPKGNGGYSLDFNGAGDITLSDFKNFVNFANGKPAYNKVDDSEAIDYANRLGLSIYDQNGSKVEIKDGKFTAAGYKYVRVPITKRMNQANSPSGELNRFDEYYEKLMFGGNNAAKMAETTEEWSFNN